MTPRRKPAPVLTGFSLNVQMAKDGNGILGVFNQPEEWIVSEHVRRGLIEYFREHGMDRWPGTNP